MAICAVATEVQGVFQLWQTSARILWRARENLQPFRRVPQPHRVCSERTAVLQLGPPTHTVRGKPQWRERASEVWLLLPALLGKRHV
jgi:hypothetical protein